MHLILHLIPISFSGTIGNLFQGKNRANDSFLRLSEIDFKYPHPSINETLPIRTFEMRLMNLCNIQDPFWVRSGCHQYTEIHKRNACIWSPFVYPIDRHWSIKNDDFGRRDDTSFMLNIIIINEAPNHQSPTFDRQCIPSCTREKTATLLLQKRSFFSCGLRGNQSPLSTPEHAVGCNDEPSSTSAIYGGYWRYCNDL